MKWSPKAFYRSLPGERQIRRLAPQFAPLVDREKTALDAGAVPCRVQFSGLRRVVAWSADIRDTYEKMLARPRDDNRDKSTPSYATCDFYNRG